jgi:hypothetical protein
MSKQLAVMDGNMVVNVIECEDDWPETGSEIRYSTQNPAYIGGDYVGGYFYPPQPFPSWVRDSGCWNPPVPYPSDGGDYDWDEPTLSWVESAT